MVRALLTDGERDAVRDADGMDDNTKSSHLSRVRRKFKRLAEDAELLQQHRPEMYDDMRASVCERPLEFRIEHMERQLDALDDRVDRLESHHPGDNNTNNTTNTTQE